MWLLIGPSTRLMLVFPGEVIESKTSKNIDF